jgi:hypothetical protein
MSYTINPDTLSSLLYPVSYRNIEPSAVVQQQVDVYVGGTLAGSFLAAQTGQVERRRCSIQMFNLFFTQTCSTRYGVKNKLLWNA